MTPASRTLLAGLVVAAVLLPAAPTPAAPGTPAWERRLDPFLKRVARGTRVVRGRFVEAVRPGSPALLRSLPPFVRADGRADAPALFVKAGAAGAAAQPGPERARLRADLAAAGATVRAETGPILSLRVPVGALPEVARLEGIAWLKAARSYRLLNEVSTESNHLAADQAHADFGTRGAGAIVSVVDTGLDWANADFRNPDGTTRVLGIWDQTLPVDPLVPPPPGFSFGQYFDADRIDAALASGDSLATGDGHGHGTHVAGTAAGNGLATGNGVPAGTFAGVAPEAGLLIVRVFDDDGVFCQECDLTAAVQFTAQVAAATGQPWVGNMSLGTDLGAHDGTDPDELAIAAAVGPGRRGAQMAIAAGNSGARRMHWEDTLSQGAVFTNTFGLSHASRPDPDNDFLWMDLWYDGTDRATFEVTTPGGATVRAAPGADSGIVCTADGAVQVDATNLADPENRDNQVFTQIWDASDCGGTPVATGTWTIRLVADTVADPPGAFDLWNEADLETSTGSPITHATLQTFTLDESVGVPATARHALTAGSYISKCQWQNVSGSTTSGCSTSSVGTLSSFSSIGPTRDGRLKPDVAAPGEWVGSSLSEAIRPFVSTLLIERDGMHWALRGTSMAAPHAAGTAALLLSINPSLQGSEVRAAIVSAARSDSQTGSVPNARFGHGKLRALEAGAQAASVVTDLAAITGSAFTGTDSPLMDAYNVYRGAIPGLSATDYGACFLSGLPSPSFADSAAPPAGQAFFYLVAGVRGGVEGFLGTDSDGRIRPNNAPCP
jgi:subtilisin family serine protease